jgi:hypothetical protein
MPVSNLPGVLMPLTLLDRQKRLRERRAKMGLFPMTVYAQVQDRDLVHAFAQALASRRVEGVVMRNEKTGRVVTVPLDCF